MEPNRYIYGSAAPQLPERHHQQEQQVQRPPARRKAAVVMPEPVRYPAGKMVFCIVVGFLILFTLISRFATITEMNGQLASMNSQLEKLRDDNRKLQAEISASVNQENIRQIAEERLNMKMPDSYQRIPVNIPKVNYSTTTLQAAKEESTLISFFSDLFE
ncbi:MAG: cell division protein FtsL [Thermoclostridium sp.]|nr:cell division protein FtsL [Thermoclostridium sp.]